MKEQRSIKTSIIMVHFFIYIIICVFKSFKMKRRYFSYFTVLFKKTLKTIQHIFEYLLRVNTFQASRDLL